MKKDRFCMRLFDEVSLDIQHYDSIVGLIIGFEDNG